MKGSSWSIGQSGRTAALAIAIAVLAQGLAAQGRRSAPKPESPPARVPNVRPQQFLVLRGPELEMGEDGADGPTLFSHISSVAEFADGTIVVADASDNTLRVFDAEGRHLSTFGRRGRGPGEFANPVTLLKLDERRLVAMQPFFGATLLHREGGELALARAATREWDFIAGCATPAGAVVSVWDGTHALHRLGPDLTPLRAFADGWSRDSVPALVRMQNSAGGQVACDADGRVAFAQPSGPRVRLYGPDDGLRWEIELPSYRFSQFLMTGGRDGRGAATTVFYGDDITSALWFLDPRTVVVQVSRRDLGSCGMRARNGGSCYPSIVRVTTYFLGADDGRLLGRTSALPTLFSGGGPSMFRSVDDPFPQLLRYRVTPAARR